MVPLIIFITGIVATALSSMSGGGTSIINIPVLLWLGVPFPLAIATSQVNSTFWVLPASYNYLKDRKVDWLFLILFSLVGLIGAYFGVQVVLNTDSHVLQTVIGILILLLVTYTYFKREIGLSETKTYPKARQLLAYPFALLLGFYESVFGSGNGIAFAIVSFYTKGFDFVDALGYYFAVAFPWVVFAAILFITKGYYSFEIMLPAVLGSVIGGFIGSKYAKHKGNRFIKLMFVIVGGFLGLKLLLGI